MSIDFMQAYIGLKQQREYGSPGIAAASATEMQIKEFENLTATAMT